MMPLTNRQREQWVKIHRYLYWLNRMSNARRLPRHVMASQAIYNLSPLHSMVQAEG